MSREFFYPQLDKHLHNLEGNCSNCNLFSTPTIDEKLGFYIWIQIDSTQMDLF